MVLARLGRCSGVQIGACEAAICRIEEARIRVRLDWRRPELRVIERRIRSRGWSLIDGAGFCLFAFGDARRVGSGRVGGRSAGRDLCIAIARCLSGSY